VLELDTNRIFYVGVKSVRDDQHERGKSEIATVQNPLV